jgi:hypothetical protein
VVVAALLTIVVALLATDWLLKSLSVSLSPPDSTSVTWAEDSLFQGRSRSFPLSLPLSLLGFLGQFLAMCPCRLQVKHHPSS